MAIFDINGNYLTAEENPYAGLEDIRNDRLLIWHDEFNENAIDVEKWKTIYGYRNAYGTFIYPENLNRNTSVNGGVLDYFALKDHPSSNAVYSCPWLTTSNLFEFRYGLIEAKIKFSSEAVYHSTFWTLGANSERICTSETEPIVAKKGVLFPSCGEIDIAECNNGTVEGVTHYSPDGIDTETYSGSSAKSLTSSGADWHIYGVEWTATTITFYCDRVAKGSWTVSSATVDGYNPFLLPHYLILNCVPYLSGTPTWDEMHTLVDWVRVYAPQGTTEYVKETALTLGETELAVAVDGKAILTYTFTPENPSDQTIIWQSMNESICTCYGGKVIGVSAGTTFVKATSKHGYTALCKVTVS